jgi:hypothetical protein
MLVSATFLPLPAPRHPKSLGCGDRLNQAISICQKWCIPILHAHLKSEPLVLKPGGPMAYYIQPTKCQTCHIPHDVIAHASVVPS